MLALVAFSAAKATVGGQAVMHGVMMRGRSHWAVAIRRYNGEIVAVHRAQAPLATRRAWARLPIVRGVVSLGESLAIGVRALSISSHYASEWYEHADDEPGEPQEISEPNAVVDMRSRLSEIETGDDEVVHFESQVDDSELQADEPSDSLPWWQLALAIAAAIGFSVLLFKVAPALVVNHFVHDNGGLGFALIEGALRLTVFIGYLGLVALLPDMRTVFEYHSAEHKAINTFEDGGQLSPDEVNEASRIHVRCGTAFMLWVMVVAIFAFALFGHLAGHHLSVLVIVASRVLLLLPIAGLSFELIRFAGRHSRNRLLRMLLAPGLWLQRLTTRECNAAQCEVAIRALQVVLELDEDAQAPQPLRVQPLATAAG